MNQTLNSRASVLTLIVGVHAAALWLIVAGLHQQKLVPPSPLPAVMVEMLPAERPVVKEVIETKPQPEPVKEIPKVQPKKAQPKPQPKKPSPKTTTSDKALTAPKSEAEPVQQASSAPVEPSPPPPAPVAAAPRDVAPAPAPVPITPPRFNAAYLNNPAPTYPPMLRRAGEEGRVVLRVFVTAEGTAGEVHVLRPSSSPLFDEAALAAVRKYRFVPARRGDTAVAEWVQVPIEFKLN
ncbi:TonB family protein [Herbaspirillum sp. GCM10030257]|uniref:energy transducer TonB n=1 Tax=Herbaspirillum sp. GCM10030257 TaxID=3273393 RepID=UPI003612BA82